MSSQVPEDATRSRYAQGPASKITQVKPYALEYKAVVEMLPGSPLLVAASLGGLASIYAADNRESELAEVLGTAAD